MKTILKTTLFLFLAILIHSCHEDDSIGGDSGSQGNEEFDFGSQVQRDFIGIIKDETNTAIGNAEVNIGTETVQTDANGVFVITDVSVQERFAYIEVNKAGYLKGLKTVVPTEDVNSIEIVLLAEQVQALPSNNEIQLSNGTKVTFDGSFEDANGNAYTGAVYYSMNHIDPASPNIANEMPGMLLGKTAGDDFEMLQTYGMLHVSLTDASGNSLQIAAGSSAEIRMPIPTELQSGAPTTIPLWSFDEAVGYWVEEGFATKTGNEYVGTVAHFSWWNCDISFQTELLCLIVEDVNGNPLANVNVDLTFPGNPFPGEGISNQYGQICGVVPSNEVLTLTAYDSCGNTLLTDTIGPLSGTSSTTITQVLTIPNSSALQVVTGNFLDCNNNPVTNGYVEYLYDGKRVVFVVTSGVFEISTLICNSDTNAIIEGVDYGSDQSTGSMPILLTPPTTNLGTLFSCNAIDEYMTYQLDNNPAVTTTSVLGDKNIYSGGFDLYGTPQDPLQEYYFSIQTITPGIYTLADFNGLVVITEIDLNTNISATQNFQIVVNNFSTIGGFIDVAFSGDYVDGSGITHSISGTLHVRRDT